MIKAKFMSVVGMRFGAGVIGAAMLTGAMLVSGPSSAHEIAPMDIVFIEDDSKIARSISDDPGDPVAGRKAFSNRKLGNCLACHINTEMSELTFHGEIGPPLDGVADRYSKAELRAILVDSKRALDKDTMMPGFYSLNVGARLGKSFEGKTILSSQQVEDILAYVITLK